MSLISIFFFLYVHRLLKSLVYYLLQYNMKSYQKLDTKKLGLKQYCRLCTTPNCQTEPSHWYRHVLVHTHTSVHKHACDTRAHTHTSTLTRTHRGTETRSKQWDKLRQNILRPMQAPPPPEAELRQQGCTAPTFGMLVHHMFTVRWSYPETPDSDQLFSYLKGGRNKLDCADWGKPLWVS